MDAIHRLRRSTISLGAIGLGLVLSAQALAAPPTGGGPPPKPACGTNGAIGMTPVSPALYSYTLGESGYQDFSFTVSSPGVNPNPSCDSSLPYVFGNGRGSDPRVLPLTITLDTIEENGVAVSTTTEAALRGALTAFATAPFQLTPPGVGNQVITFSFTNSNSVPVGTYDLTIDVTSAESGIGVDPVSGTFTIEVEEQQAVDTLAPIVNMVSPSTGDVIKLNDTLSVSFTAEDPVENGVGTGLRAMRATIATSCNDAFYSLTSVLGVDPALPQTAGVVASASTSITPWLSVGTFTVTAEADDFAEHTGFASATFTAGANVAPLPPISVPNRQFNIGSTVPIKFTLKDGSGLSLPPMDGLVVRIKAPTLGDEERVAGSGAENVRWETDEYGSVTHYITNYAIPEIGTYTVEIYLKDTCDELALQGSFTFVAANKGGKR